MWLRAAGPAASILVRKIRLQNYSTEIAIKEWLEKRVCLLRQLSEFESRNLSMGYISKGVPSKHYLAFFLFKIKKTMENVFIQAVAYIIVQINTSEYRILLC